MWHVKGDVIPVNNFFKGKISVVEGKLKEITVSCDIPIGRGSYFLRALKVVRLNVHSFLKFRKMWSRSVVKFLSLRAKFR